MSSMQDEEKNKGLPVEGQNEKKEVTELAAGVDADYISGEVEGENNGVPLPLHDKVAAGVKGGPRSSHPQDTGHGEVAHSHDILNDNNPHHHDTIDGAAALALFPVQVADVQEQTKPPPATSVDINVAMRITTFLGRGRIQRANKSKGIQAEAMVIKTPGFIMLKRLYKMTEPEVLEEAEAFDDLCAKKYKDVKTMRTRLSKQGPSGMLSGKLKRKNDLLLMFKAAGEAIMLTQENVCPDLLRQVRKVIQAKQVLNNSPELRSLFWLQAVMRRRMPVVDIHESLAVLVQQLHYRRMIAANKTLLRVARARVTSESWFIQHLSVVQQSWMIRRRGEEARALLRTLYDRHLSHWFMPAVVLEMACKRSLDTRAWSRALESAVLISATAKAALKRYKYEEAPAMAGIVLGFFPQASATSMMGTHLCRCAKNHLSMGAFAHASSLLKEAKQQIIMAQAKMERKRRVWAQEVVASAALKFYMKRVTRAAKLKRQLREAEQNVHDAISAKIRGMQLKLLKDAANILRKQTLQALVEQENKLAETAKAILKTRRQSGASKANGVGASGQIVLWDVEQVCEWLVAVTGLDGLAMGMTQKLFRDAAVDGARLITLSMLDIIAMGVKGGTALEIEEAAQAELDFALQARGTGMQRLDGADDGVASEQTLDLPLREKDGDQDTEILVEDGENGENGSWIEEDVSDFDDEHSARGERDTAKEEEVIADDTLPRPHGEERGIGLPPISIKSRKMSRRMSTASPTIQAAVGMSPEWRLQREQALRAKNLKRNNASPRIWTADREPQFQGARVQQAALIQVLGLPLKSTDEQRLLHSFEEAGCLCQHNWICPRCFVWNRAETRYDGGVCIWCYALRPEDYHPPSWKGGSEFGSDSKCPVFLAVKQARGSSLEGIHGQQDRLESRRHVQELPKDVGSKSEEAGDAAALPRTFLPAIKVTARPRDSYPRMPMHPPLGTMRHAGDADRIDQEWQAVELGLGVLGSLEDVKRDMFEDEELDFVDRSGALTELKPSATWDWNPVGRFVANEGSNEELAENMLKWRPVGPLSSRQYELSRARIGIKKSDDMPLQ